MKNPFRYGGIVEGAAFCNGKKELADLAAAAESKLRNLVLMRLSAHRQQKGELVEFRSSPLMLERGLFDEQ